jgi:hypothetical protein
MQNRKVPLLLFLILLTAEMLGYMSSSISTGKFDITGGQGPLCFALFGATLIISAVFEYRVQRKQSSADSQLSSMLKSIVYAVLLGALAYIASNIMLPLVYGAP